MLDMFEIVCVSTFYDVFRSEEIANLSIYIPKEDIG